MQTTQAPRAEGAPRSTPPTTLASIAIPSFASFHSQSSSTPVPIAVHSPIKRRPLPADSPIAPAFSNAQLNARKLNRQPPTNILSPPSTDDELLVPRNLDDNPHGTTPRVSQTPFPSRDGSLPLAKRNPLAPRHDRSISNFYPKQQSRTAHARSPTVPNMPSYTTTDTRPPELSLRLDGVADDPHNTNPNKKPSPAGGFTSFFGWSSSKQNGEESPATTFSEKSLSPSDSPRRGANMSKSKPNGLDIPAANSLSSYFNVPGTPLLSSSPQMNAHVEELERELRQLSSELAASIQREMELEDEVERWKAESSSTMPDNRRTSDYYSDSGASSVRFPISDPDLKLEELDTQRRKAEQQRAELKVQMAERLQEELRRRRDLEEQVQQLEEKVSDKSRAGSIVETPEIKQLAISLEDAKRRLAEERQVKENFEDLLTALKQELEKYRNEADNLRDEVVPQLRARLEVLESEAGSSERHAYETTRMQQEIQQLRAENQALSRQSHDGAAGQVRFQAIAEEGAAVQNLRIGLTRSNSLARSGGLASKRGSLSRSNSVKARSGDMSPQEGAPSSNPVKELEEQRDALHKALKYLLQRQEMQQKDFQRRLKEVEAQRDSALNLTPRRTAFHKEVSDLRQEVNSLRRRADDALEQKWQCEKGLGGLRMDLDRAQQETGSLRDLLREHDIAIPEIRLNDEQQSISLDKAYQELRTTHALSLARVQQMEGDSLANGPEAEKTLALLKQSISDAEAERDTAQKEAEQYRQQARALQRAELEHLGKEQKLSSELFAAATRMDELSERIQQQLEANTSLRSRLTDAITRGELEQQKSTEQIIELERRLKTAEDKVMIAQQSSEDAIAQHETEVAAIKESNNSQLRRARSGLLSPAAFSPKMPSSPVFAQRSPRLDMTRSGPAMTFAEATKTELLEKRVEELEKALRDADREMKEVVGRMNVAQIEVADLQFEKDEAMRQTRKLQADILAEREKVKVLMSSA